jgi:UDP-N-acetylglucosamine 2-epimerase (non-hydrolysing)
MGVRPEIVKMAPVVHALERRRVPYTTFYTNQHSRDEMSGVFFRTLGFKPHVWFEEEFRRGRVLDALVYQFQSIRVSTVVCQGDTTTTMLAALAGVHAGCRVVHLEAGLRSFDDEMLEERHRRAVDHIADELLTYTSGQSLQLQQECVRGQITWVGNPLVDVVEYFREDMNSFMWTEPFLYVTMHRKEFTDRPERMESTFLAILTCAKELGLRVVYPAHPRTIDCAERAGLTWPFQPQEPVGILESLARIRSATVVITDSGGVQEEAALLGTPCVTVRENTERPETVESGVNVIVGFDPTRLWEEVRRAASTPKHCQQLYGPPGVGDRIANVLMGE